MSPRASTPAGRQRATQRVRGGPAAKRKAPAKGAVKKRTPVKPATKAKTKATSAKSAAPRKAPAKRAAPRKATTRKAAPKRKPTRRGPAKAPRVGRGRLFRARRSRSGFAAAILRPRTLVFAVLIVAALGAGYRFWLRDSSLIAVTHVKVAGAEGPEASAVTQALKRTGDGMSSLSADQTALEKSVAGFPTVAGLQVDTDFPHGMTVTVDSRPPVMLIDTGSKQTPVAGDGTILAGVDEGHTKLPVVQLDRSPAAAKVTGDALAESMVLGPVPDPMRPLIDKVRFRSDQGVVVTLAGLPIIFGTADRVEEKWTAVATTLADPSLDSLSYLDVRVPERPAAGGAGETVADAPDPATTVAPTDIVPATDATTAADPAAVTPTATPSTDPTVTPITPAADPAATATGTATPAATDTAPPTTETPTGSAGGGIAP